LYDAVEFTLFRGCGLSRHSEAIVRDRFEGQQDRILDECEFANWAVSEVSVTDPLLLLDLRSTGLLKLGVSTDAARAKAHRKGQRLSKEVYQTYALDGLLYASRLTAADCVAVYDRAVDTRVVASPAVELLRVAHLIPALQSINVSVRANK
jgi:hypothetical protein